MTVVQTSLLRGYLIANLLQVFDRNNSGFISRCDLKRVMLEIVGEDVSDEEIDLMMLEADKDQNGKIDYEEFKMLQQVMFLYCFIFKR